MLVTGLLQGAQQRRNASDLLTDELQYVVENAVRKRTCTCFGNHDRSLLRWMLCGVSSQDRSLSHMLDIDIVIVWLLEQEM